MAEGFLLMPLLMGRAGRMNGASVFVALTVWGFLWGLWGMLLAVPLTMMIKVICEHIEGLHSVSRVPTAYIVELQGANLFMFLSNKADVLREVRAFAATLTDR